MDSREKLLCSRCLPLIAVRTQQTSRTLPRAEESHVGWRYVTSGAGVQPQLAERILTYISVSCAVAVRCDFADGHVAIRHVAFLRPQSWRDIPNILAHVPRT